mmetsp:Transcript_20906/g.42681  ORF Transcript_20906/g.42681 Transcript_20906/m.42681 type:complete len:282 (-) Transcript_20906:685-1530(-)
MIPAELAQSLCTLLSAALCRLSLGVMTSHSTSTPVPVDLQSNECTMIGTSSRGVPRYTYGCRIVVRRRPTVSPTVVTRYLSSAAGGGDDGGGDGGKPLSKSDVRSVSAGLPDWIEHWSRDNFRNVGYGLAATSICSIPVGYPMISAALATTTAAYWAVGLRDIRQTKQTIRRNFPVLGNMRYLLESVRPEIRQYFVESDTEAVPFSRSQRTIAYMRAKGSECTMPFGTRRDVNAIGYEWANHSLYPTKIGEQRVMIGRNNPETTLLGIIVEYLGHELWSIE